LDWTTTFSSSRHEKDFGGSWPFRGNRLNLATV
jgi:hypothetical protein